MKVRLNHNEVSSLLLSTIQEIFSGVKNVEIVGILGSNDQGIVTLDAVELEFETVEDAQPQNLEKS